MRVGMALKAHLGDRGMELWDAWSGQSEQYDRKGLKTWNSFRGGGVTVATIFHLAREHGRA